MSITRVHRIDNFNKPFKLTEKNGAAFTDLQKNREFKEIYRNSHGLTIFSNENGFSLMYPNRKLYKDIDNKTTIFQKIKFFQADEEEWITYKKNSFLNNIDGSFLINDHLLVDKNGIVFKDWAGHTKFDSISRNNNGSTITEVEGKFYLTNKDGSKFTDSYGHDTFDVIMQEQDDSITTIYNNDTEDENLRFEYNTHHRLDYGKKEALLIYQTLNKDFFQEQLVITSRLANGIWGICSNLERWCVYFYPKNEKIKPYLENKITYQ